MPRMLFIVLNYIILLSTIERMRVWNNSLRASGPCLLPFHRLSGDESPRYTGLQTGRSAARGRAMGLKIMPEALSRAHGVGSTPSTPPQTAGAQTAGA